MDLFANLLEFRSTSVLFNIAVVLVFYVAARLLSARGPIALAFAFSPLILAWAYDNAQSTGGLAFLN